MYKLNREFSKKECIMLPPLEQELEPYTLEQEHLLELDKKIGIINKNLALFDDEIKKLNKINKINKKSMLNDRTIKTILISQLILVMLLLIQK